METPHINGQESYGRDLSHASYTQDQAYQQPFIPAPGLEVAPQVYSEKFHHPASSPGASAASTPGTILGLRRTTFFLSLALIIVILAAAVGGGVGGTLAVQNARNSVAQATATRTVTVTVAAAHESSATESTQSETASSTTTSTTTSTNSGTSTSFSRLVVPTGRLALDCPSMNDSQQRIKLGDNTYDFNVTCGTDFSGQDFGAVIVYSFHDCMQACAAHNFFSGENQCKVAHFTTMMDVYIPSDYGNCWLKGGSEKMGYGGGDEVASAVLVS